MKEYDPIDSCKFIFNNAPEYAKAKGKLAEVEAFKSSLKAIQMKKSNEQSLGAQEREAYASQEYQNHCIAIGVATEMAELLKWRLEAAKMRWETWRTQQANDRQLDRMTK